MHRARTRNLCGARSRWLWQCLEVLSRFLLDRKLHPTRRSLSCPSAAVEEVRRDCAQLRSSAVREFAERVLLKQADAQRPHAHTQSLVTGQTSMNDKSAWRHSLDEPLNLSTLASLLKHFGKAKAVSGGRRVHDHILERGYGWDTPLGNCLAQMYGACGKLEDALAVFDTIPNPDSYSWNILIKVYGENGSLEHSRNVFDAMPHRDVVSWNVMIALFVQHGHSTKALDLFEQMQSKGVKPNNVTFVSVVDACTTLKAFEMGQEIHATITDSGYEDNLVVGTALINMYSKSGSVDDARHAFCRLPFRDVVCWTAMIGAFSENKRGKEALDFFRQMQAEGVHPNSITFICAVEACANLRVLEDGQKIHVAIVVSCYGEDIKVGNALLDMYSKCGNIEFATSVFSNMACWTAVSWNVMIAAFGQNGQGKEALALFGQMQHQGEKPDSITFIAVLTACSHAGFVEDGMLWFLVMESHYNIIHMLDHYVCMIDLLGRAGCLDEAEDLIKDMPFENTVVPWLSLLGACRIHGDVARGMRVAKHCIELDPEHGASYVMLSNLYAGGMT